MLTEIDSEEWVTLERNVTQEFSLENTVTGGTYVSISFWISFLVLVAWMTKKTLFDPLNFWQDLGVKVDSTWAYPYFGHLWGIWKKHIYELEFKAMHELSRIYGYYEGSRPVLEVADPDAIKELMITRFNDFTDRRLPFEPAPKYIRKFIFWQKAEEWKIMRNAMSPFFTMSKTKDKIPVMNQCVNEMVAKTLQEAGTDGIEVNMKIASICLSMDTITRCVYGIKVPGLDDQQHPVIRHSSLFNKHVESPFIVLVAKYPLLAAVLYHILPDFMGFKNINFFVQLGKEILAQKAKVGITEDKTNSDFMDLLLKIRKTEEKTGSMTQKKRTIGNDSVIEKVKMTRRTFQLMNDEMILGQAFFLVIAGFETTSSVLAGAAYRLALDPACQEKLYRELKKKFPDSTHEMTQEDLSECHYLEKVVKEALRMFPPIYRLERVAVRNTEIAGIPLKKGQVVAVPVWAIQHSPDYYENPEDFDPDRWDPEQREELKPFTWIPFGLGPRMCMGKRFALENLKVTLAKWVLNFRLEKGPRTPTKFECGPNPISLTPRDIFVKLVPRISPSFH